jgi:dihydrofolate reductase
MSRNSLSIDGVEVTNEAPQALLERLTMDGYESVVISGGSQIYSLFMEQSLIDEVHVTVEPIFMGNGTALFNKSLEAKCSLTSSEKLNNDTLINIYKVKK